MSVMRRWAIGDWIHTGEMSWKPWRIGTYKQDKAGTKDREDLETILRRMTTDFTAVISDAMDIKVEWPGGAATRGGTHAEIVNVLGQEMSKAVLGHLETQSSSLSGNTDAKAKDGVRKELRETRARVIAADITRDLITPMIRLNFGEAVEVPRFEFITTDEVDLLTFSGAIKNFRDAGMNVPQAWVRDRCGIPEPKKGEPMLGPAPAPPAGGQPEAQVEEPNTETPSSTEEPSSTDDE